MVHLGTILQHGFGRPAAGVKTNDIVNKPCAIHFVFINISCPCTFLVFCGFIVFDVLESSLDWFFTLIAFKQKRECSPT